MKHPLFFATVFCVSLQASEFSERVDACADLSFADDCEYRGQWGMCLHAEGDQLACVRQAWD